MWLLDAAIWMPEYLGAISLKSDVVEVELKKKIIIWLQIEDGVMAEKE